jgi:hypothetical protein
MKSLLVLLAVAASLSLLALAQSVEPAVGSANPAPAAGSPAPNAAAPSLSGSDAAAGVPISGQSAGPTLEKPMPLMPETIPASSAPGKSGKSGKGGKSRKAGGAGASASPGASPTGTFEVEQDIRLRIRIREAQTRALNDPDIQADWAAAHHTRSDPARRIALTLYYNHLYDRMSKIDPTIADRANARKQAAIARLYYVRLGEDAPSEDPFATPTPPAEGPNPPSEDAPAPF